MFDQSFIFGGNPKLMNRVTVINKRERLAHFFQNHADVLTTLSDPTTVVQLPFPSCTIDIPRISLNAAGEFSFCGREKLDQLCDWMLDDFPATCRVIRGNMGSGKSMMIGAAVLRFMQPNIANERKVIYIPDCERASMNGLEWSLLKAIAIAFHDDATYHFDFQQFRSCNVAPHRDYIFQFLGNIARETKIMFVFDGFDYYEPTAVLSANKADERNYLLNLATKMGSCIVALSSQNQSSFLKTSSDYCIDGGLSKIEWAGWSTRAPFQHFTAFASDPLIDYTGLIPLILRKFSSYSDSTFEERVYRYEHDYDVGYCGGGAVRNELTSFIDLVWQQESDINKSIFVDMMTNALSGRPCGNFNTTLVDHRFFYYENNVIHPICGFVKRVIANHLPTKSDTRMEYFTNLNRNWLNEALSFAGNNSSMREFYYEKYAIAQIIIRAAQRLGGWNNIFIHYFHLNFPSASQLSTKLGLHVYLPEQYNQRYVNMVIRSIYSDTLSKNNKKRTIIKAFVQFIQITLQQPTQHTSSFNVFTTLHNEDSINIPDYQRYVLEHDPHPLFGFHWVTPHTVDSIPPLPIAVRNILGNPHNDPHKSAADIVEEVTMRYTWDIFTV